MNTFMFVAVVCIAQNCHFSVSNDPLPSAKCESIKKDFLALPFKPEVTLAATQCVKVEPKERFTL